MNFLRGRLAPLGDGIAFVVEHRGTNHLLALPTGRASVADWLGKDVMLGLRPERVTERGGEGATSIDCYIDLVEPTGPDTLVSTTLNGTKVCARVHPRAAPRPQQTMTLAFDMSQCALFDPATDRRIGGPR
jgi:multiple sugar transport system ATP-binding protein